MNTKEHLLRFASVLVLALLLASCGGTILEMPPGTTTELQQRLRSIWMIGGITSGPATSGYTNPIAQVDLYDPVLDTWSAAVTTLPTPVSFAAAAAYNGKIYVMGGFDVGGVVRRTVQIYDVAADSWSSGADMPAGTPRGNVYAAVVSDRIYLLGGTGGNANAGWSGSLTTLEYVPASDLWNTKGNYSTTNYSDRLLLPFNDVIYNLGGRMTNGATPTTAHDGFSVSGNTTTGSTEVVLTAARTGAAGVVYTPSIGPAVLAIVGGFSAIGGTTQNYVFQGATTYTPINTFQYLRYPFTAPSTWTTGPASYFLPMGFASAALADSRMYVFGGTAGSSSATGINNVYWFDLSNLSAGAWTAAASMPVGRFGHVAVAVQ
jgi:hypothetical protein